MKTYITDKEVAEYWMKNYSISETGVVTRVAVDNKLCGYKPGKVLKPEITQNGYSRVTLLRSGKTKRLQLHRLVAFFHCQNDRPEEFNIVNHKDGDPSNNSSSNLEWTDYSGNIIHAYKMLNRKGPEGERQGNSKLTDEIVYKLRELSEEFTYTQLARMYGVHRQTVAVVLQGNTWTHI